MNKETQEEQAKEKRIVIYAQTQTPKKEIEDQRAIRLKRNKLHQLLYIKKASI